MNIDHWISWWADRTPTKVAIRFKGAEISYREFAVDIDQTANALQALGIKAGDRIGWLGFNSPAFLSALFACARIGAIVVPLNFRLAPAEHMYILENAGAKLFVFDPRFGASADAAAGRLKRCTLVSSTEEPHAEASESLPQLKLTAQRTTDGALADPESPLLIVYTSGTTGRPKGAVMTQRAVHWNGLNSQLMHDLRRDDHVLATLPFFHVGGLNIQTTPALQSGATVTLIEKFHPGDFLALVERDKPSLTVLVPTQMQAIVEHPRWRDADLSSLRCVTTGSTAVQVPLLNIWHDHDIPIIQIYGCTESGPIAIHQVLESAQTSAGSIGRPAMYCDVRIVDGQGKDVGDGEAGEILLHGPNILKEYWNDSEATAECLQQGWLQTGDIGFRDTHGDYFIVDRKKRMIISGGENIYPSELERILLEHRAIAEAVVVGYPHEKWGEVPAVAFVSNDANPPDKKTLASLFEGRVGHLKHPRYFVRFDALPKNAMGKVVYADVQAELVSRLTG
ncbi:MAG: class I adenylate-forming enzyme family protein [Woeseiaceae bacterium]